MSRFTRKNRENIINKETSNYTNGGAGIEGDTGYCKGFRISSSPNMDPTYKRIGIFHVSAVTGLNAFKGSLSEIMSDFGSGGYDAKLYSLCQDDICEKLNTYINKNQKVTDLTVTFDTEDNEINTDHRTYVYGNIACHAFGTLYEKI